MAFGYHAAVLIFSFRDFESSCANNVTMENRPSSAGVERKIALSDHWRWVSTPKCARTSSNEWATYCPPTLPQRSDGQVSISSTSRLNLSSDSAALRA